MTYIPPLAGALAGSSSVERAQADGKRRETRQATPRTALGDRVEIGEEVESADALHEAHEHHERQGGQSKRRRPNDPKPDDAGEESAGGLDVSA